MFLGSEKLWQTAVCGLLLAGVSTMSASGQMPQPIPSPMWARPVQPVFMPHIAPAPVPVWTQSEPATAYFQPQYGAPPAPVFQQPGQYQPWTPPYPMTAAYAPQYAPQYDYQYRPAAQPCPAAPVSACPPRASYQQVSSQSPTCPHNPDLYKPPGNAPRWTETECDYPAAPMGASLSAYRNVMRTERHNVSMVLYRYDFVDDCEQLNAKGRERLRELAALSARNAASITIEDVPEEPRLAMLRRETVISELMKRSSGISPDRVIIRSVTWPQLRGEEAELVRNRLLKQTTTGGPAALGSTGRSGR